MTPMLAHPADRADACSALVDSIQEHPGMAELHRFGGLLRRRPLDAAALRVFLASTAEFFREIPGGILALALRLTDDWLLVEPFDAVSRGAQILYSAVDEFGLHQLRRGVQESHHAFFRSMAAGFGVSETELLDPGNVIAAARQMAALTRRYYRDRPLPEGLGFHLASELTSDVEFRLCLEGFRAFPREYGLDSPNSAKLGFYLIHTQVEPMHGASSRAAAAAYLVRMSDSEAEIRAGAEAFMCCYRHFFRILGERLSPEQSQPPPTV